MENIIFFFKFNNILPWQRVSNSIRHILENRRLFSRFSRQIPANAIFHNLNLIFYNLQNARLNKKKKY